MSVNSEQVLAALRHVQDPDLHRDIVDLGFVKNLVIEGGAVRFDVELTTPACPVKEDLKRQCEHMVKALPGVDTVSVNMTAQPVSGLGKRGELLKQVRHVLAVASGKGGVGKSTATANLAVALAQAGAKVGVLDADIYGPSMNLMFHVTSAPVINEQKKLLPVTVTLGIKVVSMAMFSDDEKPVIWRGPMVSQMIQNFVNNVVWGELDYLLIDMPPGTGDVQLTLTQSAPLSGAVILTTPQDVSVLDAKKGLKMFQQVSVPVLGIVENMSYFICDACTKRHYIFRQGGGKRVAESLGVPFLGEIPIEPAVAEGGDAGVPIVERNPDSPAAQAYRHIAGAIAASLSILSATQGDVLGKFDLKWEELAELST